MSLVHGRLQTLFSRAPARARVRPLALALALALPLLAPSAAAESMHDLEALHQGTEGTHFALTVTTRDVGGGRVVGLRGFDSAHLPSFAFLLEVCSADGHEMWWVNHTRGVVPFPDVAASASFADAPECGSFDASRERSGVLAPGQYVLWIHGHGAFQVTGNVVGANESENVSGIVQPPAEAWAVNATVRSFVDLTGDNVTVEQFDFQRDATTFAAPARLVVEAHTAYMLTVNGTSGARYHLALSPDLDATPARAPGFAVPTLALALVLALALRRTR
jgi:hypothetical protein